MKYASTFIVIDVTLSNTFRAYHSKINNSNKFRTAYKQKRKITVRLHAMVNLFQLLV